MEIRYCDGCGKDLGRIDAFPTAAEYKRLELTGYKPGHLCEMCSKKCARENGLKKLVDRESV